MFWRNTNLTPLSPCLKPAQLLMFCQPFWQLMLGRLWCILDALSNSSHHYQWLPTASYLSDVFTFCFGFWFGWRPLFLAHICLFLDWKALQSSIKFFSQVISWLPECFVVNLYIWKLCDKHNILVLDRLLPNPFLFCAAGWKVIIRNRKKFIAGPIVELRHCAHHSLDLPGWVWIWVWNFGLYGVLWFFCLFASCCLILLGWSHTPTTVKAIRSLPNQRWKAKKGKAMTLHKRKQNTQIVALKIFNLARILAKGQPGPYWDMDHQNEWPTWGSHLVRASQTPLQASYFC